MQPILATQTLPSASVNNISDSPVDSPDSAETGRAGFARALDTALESPADAVDLAADKSQGSAVKMARTLTATVADSATDGQILPMDGKGLPLGTEISDLLENRVEVLAPDLDALAGNVPSNEIEQPLEAPPGVFNPLVVEIDPIASRPPVVTVQSREMYESPKLLVAAELPGKLNPALELSQQRLGDGELQSRAQTAQELMHAPLQRGADISIAAELPISREAAVLSDKAGFAAAIESLVQAGTSDPGNTLQSQSTPVSGTAALARLVSATDAMPQESKMAPPAQMHAPLGSEDWGQELAVRMRWMLSANSQHANLKLNPAELGNIEIKISTDGDETRLLFVVQHASAREAIEGSLPRLREVLEHSGLSVASSDVEHQSGFAEGRDGGGHRLREFGDLSGSGPGSSEQQQDSAVEQHSTLAGSSTLIDYYI